jgi:hypothetical protein
LHILVCERVLHCRWAGIESRRLADPNREFQIAGVFAITPARVKRIVGEGRLVS